MRLLRVALNFLRVKRASNPEVNPIGLGDPPIRPQSAELHRSFRIITKRRLKVVVSGAAYVAARATHLICRVMGYPAKQKLVILYYHAVNSEFRENFARQLDILKAYYDIVSADNDRITESSRPSVAITFDDAFESVLDNALPELKSRCMPATIFVPAGVLGRQPAWDMEDGCADRGEIVASADALLAAASDLIQFGAHTLTHPHLLRISAEEARREIGDCRQQMRDIFGMEIDTLSFPYGEYSSAIVELCREAGYRRVFNSVPATLDPASAEFVRGRILVEASDGPLEFSLKISGAYSWMGYYSNIRQAFRNGHRIA